jgi:hypothetical protein
MDSDAEDEGFDESADDVMLYLLGGKGQPVQPPSGDVTLSLQPLRKLGRCSCGFRDLPSITDYIPLLPVANAVACTSQPTWAFL